MAFFESWPHFVYTPVIPDYTERLELNAGLKMFVRAHPKTLPLSHAHEGLMISTFCTAVHAPSSVYYLSLVGKVNDK